MPFLFVLREAFQGWWHECRVYDSDRSIVPFNLLRCWFATQHFVKGDDDSAFDDFGFLVGHGWMLMTAQVSLFVCHCRFKFTKRIQLHLVRKEPGWVISAIGFDFGQSLLDDLFRHPRRNERIEAFGVGIP